MASILVYGDSNTHGILPMPELTTDARLPRGQRWPDVMAEALGPDHEVVAEGLPGRTTVHDDPVDGGKRSGVEILPAILMSHQPLDLCVILLGTNDLKHRFSVTAVEIAHSVQRLGQEAQRLLPGLDILVLAPIPVVETGTFVEIFAGAEARQEGLTRALEERATANGWGFFDLAPVGAADPLDGVHWSRETHEAVGRAVAGAVLDRLEARP